MESVKNALGKIFLLGAVLSTAFFVPGMSWAANTVHEDLQETVPATVTAIPEDTMRELPGLDTTVRVQTITVELTGGSNPGRMVTFENEITPVEVGDDIFIDRLETIQGDEYFVFKDVDRRSELVVLFVLLVGCVVWFAGLQGIRALLSLGVSIAAIVFLLVPALLAGFNPALASLLIAGGVLAVVLFGTHGFGIVPRLAFAGTFVAVIVTCGLAALFVHTMRFTGFSSDEAIFLNFSTGGSLDFAGLLLGGIIIGMLGVLDDVSITQASVTAELKRANPSLSAYDLYRRAIKVGRDHVGSLVNTLALAYVGVSLPLILLFARADSSVTMTLNQELVAVEIVRIIIGSIGIILAVPLTTGLVAWYVARSDVELGDIGHHHPH